MAEALSVSARWRRRLLGGVVLLFAVAVDPSVARADLCLDASEEARPLLKHRRLVDARAQLRICAASSCEDEIRKLCDERLSEVGERLPSVIFDAKDDTGADLPRVRLDIDGVEYSDGPVGAEITLDPGAHVFRFELPDALPPLVVERRLVLVEREKGRREHVVLARARPAARLAMTAPLPATSSSPWKTAGWLTLAASAVSLGIGSAFGIVAITKNDAAGCDANNVCDDPRSRHDARSAAAVSTVGIAIGAVLAAAGIGLVVFGSRHGASAAPSGRTLTVGAW
jgi:hypothetical protein